MNAVIYARYSSDNQREESIEGQLRECTEYAKSNNMRVVATYIDRAFSAKTDARPEFQRMIRDSAKCHFGVILVWKLDRFSRNRYDSARYKALLKKHGVKVMSVTERISDGPDGIILESVLEGYAEYYSAELSYKVKRGLMENALKGKQNGGQIPLGYTLSGNQNLEIDPLTAPLVLEVFSRYAEGETMRSIVEDLNRRGLRTNRGREYTTNSFQTMFKNRKYIGEYRYQDIVIPDIIPAIVPEELFERVQERVSKNKRAPARSKADEEYLLTTKLFCGNCGKMMAGESGTSHTGKTHYYYKCSSAKRRKGCKKKAVRKDWTERAVVAATVNRVLQDEIIDKIADDLLVIQEKENAILVPLRGQLIEVKKGIDNLVCAIQQGILTASTKERLEALEARKEELEISIIREEARAPSFTKDDIVFWLSRFKDGDVDDIDYQRKMIDIFVNAIYLYDDKIVLTYNYKDGTQTVSMKDIDGSDLMGHAPPQNAFLHGGVFVFVEAFIAVEYGAA